MLKQKQRETNSNFLHTLRNIQQIISKVELDNQIDKTVESMRKNLAGKTYGLAWSGGKDSVVLDFITKRLNKPFDSCLGVTSGLEYPDFMQWVNQYRGADPSLRIYKSKHDLMWLSQNQDWLFPSKASQSSKWYKEVQHKAQNQFMKETGLQVLLTGRRVIEMNYVGQNGIYLNKGTNIIRYSPLYDWSHEMIFACMSYYSLPFAPFYSWPNGFIVGTGHWAKRRFTGDVNKNWEEIYQIDKSIVHEASNWIPSAQKYLKTK